MGISGQGQWETSVLSALVAITVMRSDLEKARCTLVQGFRGLGPRLVVSVFGLVTKLCLTAAGTGHCPHSSWGQSGSWKPEHQASFPSLFILSGVQPAVHILSGRSLLVHLLGNAFHTHPGMCFVIRRNFSAIKLIRLSTSNCILQ